MKGYTSISCFSGSSEDNETQMSIGINNKTGIPIMMVSLFDKVQSMQAGEDIPHIIAEIHMSANTVAQLRNVANYAQQAYEQASGKPYVYLDTETSSMEEIFHVPNNPELIELSKQGKS